MDDKFAEFVEYENDIFKIKETEIAFEPYKLVDNTWRRVDDSLTAMLLSYGVPTDSPIIPVV